MFNTLALDISNIQYVQHEKKMKNLDDVLDAALVKIGKDSDRQLAIAMGVTASSLSNWRSRRSTPDAYALMELQKILKIDAREILAIIESERAKTEERRGYWEEVKRSFSTKGTVVAVALASTMMLGAVPEKALSFSKMEVSCQAKCTLCKVHHQSNDADSFKYVRVHKIVHFLRINLFTPRWHALIHLHAIAIAIFVTPRANAHLLHECTNW
jgi:transcriptional regulator with XRE-family HTH domain